MAMKQLKGRGICKGIATGPVFYINKASAEVKKRSITDIAAETERLRAAVKKAEEQLEELQLKTEAAADKSSSMIFDVHRVMLSDPDFSGDIEKYISENKVCAEYAVSQVGKKFSEMMESIDNPYLQERAGDITDISERLINILTETEYRPSAHGKVIIAADDLSPSETASFNRENILGLIIRKGSSTSHTSILARTMDIPAVINAEGLDSSIDGKMVCIDGSDGYIYIEPDEDTMEVMNKKAQLESVRKEHLMKLKGKESVTRDGRKIELYANISTAADIDAALKNDAEGIGLFRSEFMYLDRKTLPSEEELFEVYRSIAEKMQGKPVIIRTLDIGADKQAPALGLPTEENPALGFRAIRICLDRTDVFKTQLRAIYRASVYGNIYIMLPMIISADEVYHSKAVMLEVMDELKSENKPYREIPVGIMIETPAAAVISDELAKLVDFFSVGTNDLTQYTLAADRQNPRLSSLFNVENKAVLRLIKTAADNIHREGKWIGICGEAAAEKQLLDAFLAMGIDELSVSSGYVLSVREMIRDAEIKSIQDKKYDFLNF